MSQIDDVLRSARTIAVVGLSPRRFRPETEIIGETCYPDLDSVPEPVDIVNIFRRSEFVPAIVEAAIRKGAKAVWMQEGVYHEEAARRAEAAGLAVVMDRCILKDHRRLAYAS
jgi:predicted CoA-binding protein